MSSFSFKRPPRRKQFMKFITKIHELLEDAYKQEQKENGTKKSDIADRLGVHKSYITRLMNGTSNMTLETLSNLAYELDRDIKIDFVKKGEHYVHGNIYQKSIHDDSREHEERPP